MISKLFKSRPGAQANSSVCKLFRPQRDITPYEAAFILSHFTPGMFGSPWRTGITFPVSEWDALAPEMKRHFVDATDEAKAA